MELRYVNHHLRSCKFKYEDIRTAAELDLFSKGDWFFKFDYKSGYHHTEIFCCIVDCWDSLSSTKVTLDFSVLGLSTGPYLFTKIQRALVKHWRGKGFRIFTYIALSGFVANEKKSQWLSCTYTVRRALGICYGFAKQNFSGA